jgi:serine/threonine protein kinase
MDRQKRSEEDSREPGSGPAERETRGEPGGETDRYEPEHLGRELPPVGVPPAPSGPGGMPDLRVVPEDRYAEFEFVGRGGMGTVYRVLDREMNRRVALKIVRTEGEVRGYPLRSRPPGPGTLSHDEFRRTARRFLQEAWVTAGLEHPGVVPVYEVARTPAGVPFYTMRHIGGRRTLHSAIDGARGPDDRLALLDVFLMVCETVDYAHTRGVVHRDLKPANIGLGDFGEVVVFDWGLAKLMGREDSEAERWRARIADLRRGEAADGERGVFGTPGFLSPEAVFGGPEETDERSDVYALGAILYLLLTGRLPFDFARFDELVGLLAETEPPFATGREPSAPEPLARVCVEALSRSPARRTPSVRALIEGVRAFQRASDGEAEVSRLMREARRAWDGAEDLKGVELLGRVEQVLARVARILEIRPKHLDAVLLAECARAARVRAVETLSRPVRRGLFR